jgi:lysophospholipase
MAQTSDLKTRDGSTLKLHDWSITHPKVSVGLLHGYGEHAGRYEHAARAWNELGLSVFGVDLRGHGRSSGIRGHVEHFSDYHYDVDALIEAVRSRASDRPIALFGHSMGALLAIDWMIAGGQKKVAGVALSSPFLGVALPVSPVKIAMGKAMSRLLPKLALSMGLHGRDVTRDPDLARVYDSDPLNNQKATVRWYTEAMDAIDRALARAGELTVPMLVLYGGADKVASADKTDVFVRSLKMADRSHERLADHYHELVNEPPEARNKIIARVGAWLVERKEARAA